MNATFLRISCAIIGFAAVLVLTSQYGLNLNLRSLMSSLTGSAAPVPTRNIDAAEKLAAKDLIPTKDNTQEEIDKFSRVVRQAFEDKKFAGLEQVAAGLRKSRALFPDGSWKLKVFYDAMNNAPSGVDHIWQRDLAAYETWKGQFPDSITARTGHIGLLASYAWEARGGKYANETPREAMALMQVRLELAAEVFREARRLAEKDPCFQLASLRVALGQGWTPEICETLVAEALDFDPTFFHVFNRRCYALLPRWHGKPGEWERYAAKATANPGGLGDEAYARVVIDLCGFYSSIFAKSDASWTKTRKGLMILRKKYPDSLEILSYTAKLATLGDDRQLARECFDLIGDRQCVSVWADPEHLVHYRTYAQTGKW